MYRQCIENSPSCIAILPPSFPCCRSPIANPSPHPCATTKKSTDQREHCPHRGDSPARQFIQEGEIVELEKNYCTVKKNLLLACR